ncbi:hypothetical protein [Asanoa siamensis]|uniref:Uncharacterized protein n=1 Tax=Asanoa siamensis TaxID=926357 RepID=A0ABQ4CXA4_9ACTN|nr:hypothetical protein [Asanoa siamensis]GIF75638.1 hypothetical protein Asi02nite_51560 [Asanoa siamensis]
MAEKTAPDLTDVSLPADVAERVRALANELHEVLHEQMVVPEPGSEARLIWMAAKMINAAAGGFETVKEPSGPATKHLAQWADVADMASDIADQALTIAGVATTVDAADSYITWLGGLALEVPTARATAWAATVQVIPTNGDEEVQPVTVRVEDGASLTLVGQPPRRHVDATAYLRVAHHLDRLGGAIGDAVLDRGQ